ncbi:MAG: hypothetical protein RLY93_20575 [Sumerlaeia bacterium]
MLLTGHLECSCGHAHREIKPLRLAVGLAATPDELLGVLKSSYLADIWSELDAAKLEASIVGAKLMAEIGGGDVSPEELSGIVVNGISAAWQGKTLSPAMRAKIGAAVTKSYQAALENPLALTNQEHFEKYPGLKNGLPVSPIIEQADERAIGFLADTDLVYFGKSITEDDSKARLRAAVEEMYLRDGRAIGKSPKELAALRERLGGAIGLEDWKLRRIIDTSVATTRNFAQVRSLEQMHAVTFEVAGPLDNLTCPHCRNMVGRTFSVTKAVKKIADLVEAGPASLPALKPFLVSQVSLPNLEKASDAELEGFGVQMPPYHPHCRHRVIAGELDSSYEEFAPPADPPPPPPSEPSMPPPKSPTDYTRTKAEAKAELGKLASRNSKGKPDPDGAFVSHGFQIYDGKASAPFEGLPDNFITKAEYHPVDHSEIVLTRPVVPRLTTENEIEKTGALPIIVKRDGHYYVKSGWARLQADKLRGATATRARVYDMDADKDAKKTPPPPPPKKAEPPKENAEAVKEAKKKKAKPKPPAPGERWPASKWKQVGPQGGSNPGGIYEDEDGVRWYVKTANAGQDAARLAEEMAANRLYAALGVPVPTTRSVDLGNGKKGVASLMIDGRTGAPSTELAINKDVRGNFVADALLGNWDVVGMSRDNLLIGKDGRAYRIDAGGSLRYRAQGAPKGSLFGGEAAEIYSLRDSSVNRASADVFGTIPDVEIARQIDLVTKRLTDDRIDEALAGVSDLADRAGLRKVLIERRGYLEKQLGLLRNAGKVKAKGENPLAKKLTKPSPPPKAKPATRAEWRKALEEMHQGGVEKPSMRGKPFSPPLSEVRKAVREGRSLGQSPNVQSAVRLRELQGSRQYKEMERRVYSALDKRLGRPEGFSKGILARAVHPDRKGWTGSSSEKGAALVRGYWGRKRGAPTSWHGGEGVYFLDYDETEVKKFDDLYEKTLKEFGVAEEEWVAIADTYRNGMLASLDVYDIPKKQTVFRGQDPAYFDAWNKAGEKKGLTHKAPKTGDPVTFELSSASSTAFDVFAAYRFGGYVIAMEIDIEREAFAAYWFGSDAVGYDQEMEIIASGVKKAFCLKGD